MFWGRGELSMKRVLLFGVLAVLSLIATGSLALRTASADSATQVSINDVTQVEGNTGTTSFVFTVSLGYKPTTEVDVNYSTQDNNATYPADYQRTYGTLVFNPGQTSKTIAVTVNGDTLHEPNESFYVNLTGAVNGTFADSQGVGTIVDDDPQPALSI